MLLFRCRTDRMIPRVLLPFLALLLVPAVPGQVLVNGDFEVTPFDAGWVNGVATVETGRPISGFQSARMGWNTTGNLDQAVSGVSADFELDLSFRLGGVTAGRTLNLLLLVNGASALNLRVLGQGTDNVNDDTLQVYDGSGWQTVSDPDFFDSTTQAYRLNVRGYAWGTATPTYDLAWSNAGSPDLDHSVEDLSFFQNAAGAQSGSPTLVRFARPYASGNSWILDDVTLGVFSDLDTDGDLMPDRWEDNNSLDKTNPADAGIDQEPDGLTNLQEYENGTDPWGEDSDGDSLIDGDEVETHGTDPTKPDSDNDGLDDGYELAANPHVTNPLLADSDQDGLEDGMEVLRLNTHPHVADTDGDGINDGDEIATGTDPVDPNSVLEVDMVMTSPSAARLAWPSRSDIGYRVEGITTPDQAPWNPGSPLPGSGWTNRTMATVDIDPQETVRSYRVTTDTSVPPSYSGIFPHLAVFNNSNEVGIGVVVPWADRLWTLTYSPHAPTGTASDKLYEIDQDLNMVIRPESIGGTPANRMIHTESEQLIMGPYFIDTNRTVRTIPYSTMPGRHTGNARHLTDPANRLYFFTMEDGLYDVNVNDLSVTTIYPDVQGTGDSHLHGYHGKGAYSGQGLLAVANNGRNWNTGDPTGDAGALATWDGTLPHTWNELFLVQHCEISGPGGIYGNADPVNDPVWATGFDARSVVLRCMEGGVFRTWRLPKASYTYDGSHGWHTEWPRIREIGGGRMLMTMHGTFWDFPATFRQANTAGIRPLSTYHKMVVDFCRWGEQLVLACNDTSKFSNNLVGQAQSNFWFIDPENLDDFGPPQGFGGPWVHDSVTAGTPSDPFLMAGFNRRVLHLAHTEAGTVNFTLEVDRLGTDSWETLQTVAVSSPEGYAYILIPSTETIEWIRLSTDVAASDVTAYLHFTQPASAWPTANSGFDAIPEAGDSAPWSGGLVRPRGADLGTLQFAAWNVDSGGTVTETGYYEIGPDMQLSPVNDASSHTWLKTNAEITDPDFTVDDASVIIDGTNYRLPKGDPVFSSEGPLGWPRGQREVVTERSVINAHGTFYEVPRSNSGGWARIRPLTTHNRIIHDFCSWRGLLVLAGCRTDKNPDGHHVVSTDGKTSLWFGTVDDLWRLGAPRGVGGPWKGSAVSAGNPSDPYLMCGYDEKQLDLSHEQAGNVEMTVEVDLLGNGTWHPYATFTVGSGTTFTHVFPEGYSAHWVRLKADTACTATATFTYGP